MKSQVRQQLRRGFSHAVGKMGQTMIGTRKSRTLTVLLHCVVALALHGCSATPVREVETLKENVKPSVSADVKKQFDDAMALMKSGDYQKGIDVLEGVVTKSQTNTVPLINLAIAHSRIGNIEKAEGSLKSALAMEPDNPVANNELGLLYRKSGRFVEARAVFEKTLQKYPNFALAHRNLGILCDLYVRDYECALKSYVAYSSAVPEDKTAKIWIADVEGRLGRK